MNDIRENVADWLSKQGFPLEFATARAFTNAGFLTDQGAYVVDPKAAVLRETDVIASAETPHDEVTYRTSVVLECKWSKERPWVIFSSGGARPTAEEWIAYNIGSSFAEAVMYKLADDVALQEIHRKTLPPRFGFGGRQALVAKQEKEQFYPAIQGVVSAAVSLAHQDDPVSPEKAVEDKVLVHVVLPAVVVEGSLFEAYLDGSNLRVEPLSHAFLRWRGFDGRAKPIIVYITTAESVQELADRMWNYCELLRFHMKNSAGVVRAALRSKRWSDLSVRAGRVANLLVPAILRGMS